MISVRYRVCRGNRKAVYGITTAPGRDDPSGAFFVLEVCRKYRRNGCKIEGSVNFPYMPSITGTIKAKQRIKINPYNIYIGN